MINKVFKKNLKNLKIDEKLNLKPSNRPEEIKKNFYKLIKIKFGRY